MPRWLEQMLGVRAPGPTIKSIMSTIVADASCLGFGHLAQLGPVLDRLSARRPRTRIILGTNYPREIVGQFVAAPVETRPLPPEAAPVPRGPTAIDIAATVEAYAKLHEHWNEVVDIEAGRLAALAPSLVIANVSYTSLAAAARLSIPSIGFCSVNWLDVFRAYCADLPAARTIVHEISVAYASAEIFLQPRPHMLMSDLANKRSIGPISRKGRDRRRELRHILRIPPTTSIVLVTLGGVLAIGAILLPADDRMHWLLQGHAAGRRADVTATMSLPFPFIDLVASVDVVVGKDSYGTVTEAVCHGTRLIVVPRPGSIEVPSLVLWAHAHGTVAVATGALDDPEAMRDAVLDIVSRPRGEPVMATGIDEAVDWIETTAAL